MIYTVTVGVQHRFIVEVAVYEVDVKFVEDPPGHFEGLDLFANYFEGRGLEDHIRIVGVYFFYNRACPFEQPIEATLAAPHVDRTAGKLGADIYEHSDIVVGVALQLLFNAFAVEQLGKSNRSGKIILEDVTGDFTVEGIIAFFGRRGGCAGRDTYKQHTN